MSSLFVGNLSSHVRHRELENVFRRFGRSNLELKDGFGFVIYEEHRDAKRALEALQGKSICGEQPSISWARKRRPFQRYTGRTNFESRDKYQSRRKSPLETDRGSEDGRRDEKFPDEVKDGLRASDTKEVEARTAEREGGWKESGPEKPGFDEESRDVDPLDSGRWEPHMDSSPENMMVDGLLENAEHTTHDKDRDNEKVHDKSHGPVDRHFERSSRGYRNSTDQYKRGRDTFAGRGQERCYNCGQSGHVKWQCRSRPKRISMHSRDGYDSRRNDLRYFGARGSFRGGGGGGRFRGGMNGSRRMLNRDIDAGIAKRGSRRHDPTGDRRHDPVDTKIHEKDRRRRRRSESPKDSSSRGRNKRKHKKQSKKSAHSSKKRQRLSSSAGSPSSSRSARSSSSSSPSGSRSRSATSRSQSSRSGSHSSSSRSHSRASPSQSSRSHTSSASSLSRSRSASSQSRKSPTKSRSRSPSSRSQRSRVISSDSPKSKRQHSSRSSSRRGSRSSTDEPGKDVAVSQKHEVTEKEAASEPAIDNGTEDRDDWRYSPEEHDTDAKRKERRQVWPREAKKQKTQRSDSEEPHRESVLQSNGVKHASCSIKSEGVPALAPQDGTANETFSEDSASRKASELPLHSQVVDTKCSLYVAIMKEGSKGTGGHNSGQELTTGSFGAARLWPWEAMLYRRIKRGPISTANYEKRKAQNEEFGIKDTFVRSSSGWWEMQEE